MSIVETLLIALALAVDAAVFAFSYGLTQTSRRLSAALELALFTGVFQGVMPLLGYLGGERVKTWAGDWDHWIVFLVFGWLGASIIRNASRAGGEQQFCCRLGLKGLTMVGLATSIDALAVGVCMALGSFGGTTLSAGQLAAVFGLIGATTFLCTVAAFASSRLLRRFPARWLETAAGLILIALGIQTLLAHLTSEPENAIPAGTQKAQKPGHPVSYHQNPGGIGPGRRPTKD